MGNEHSDRNEPKTKSNLPNTYHTQDDLEQAPDLADADLSKAEITGVDLSESELRDVDLTEATISDADLSGADLTAADLSFATLSDVNLSNTVLTDTELNYATIQQTEISEKQLQAANFINLEIIETPLAKTLTNKLMSSSKIKTIIKKADIDDPLYVDTEAEATESVAVTNKYENNDLGLRITNRVEKDSSDGDFTGYTKNTFHGQFEDGEVQSAKITHSFQHAPLFGRTVEYIYQNEEVIQETLMIS